MRRDLREISRLLQKQQQERDVRRVQRRGTSMGGLVALPFSDGKVEQMWRIKYHGIYLFSS